MNELRIVRNFLDMMTKAYRARNPNYVVVRDILMHRTSIAGMASCINKCRELGIDPWSRRIESEDNDNDQVD